MNETDIVSIENLVVAYNGKPVLNGLNLSLKKGEICSVIGEEGAGKSTLAKAITQQLKSSGKISYNGTDLNKVTTEKMTEYKIDFIAQGGNILKGFTVEEHICLALSESNKAKKNIVWEEIAQMFPKITELKKQVAGRLSGGERMILSIVCIIATDADFLILDEPTAGLAPHACKAIEDFLLRMKTERGKTILLLEHNYDFAFNLSDTVVILKEGRLSRKYESIDFSNVDFLDTELYES